MKKNILTVFIICLLLLLTGCNLLSYEGKKEIKKWEKHAKENALIYVKEKYGFNAKITKIVPEYNYGPESGKPISGTGIIFVHMKYNKRNFVVGINGDKVTTDGADNYQMPDILKDLKKEIKNVTNKDYKRFNLRYGFFKRDNNGLISDYYDKSNLKEILKENYSELVIEYLNNVNLSELKDKENILNSINKYILINYKGEGSYKKISKDKTSYLIENFETYAIYFNNLLLKDNQGTKYYEFSMRSHSNIIYFHDLKNDIDIILEESKFDYASKYEWEEYIQVSKAYLIKDNINNASFYFSGRDIKKYEKKNYNTFLNIAIECQTNEQVIAFIYGSYLKKNDEEYIYGNIDLENILSKKGCTGDVKIAFFVKDR